MENRFAFRGCDGKRELSSVQERWNMEMKDTGAPERQLMLRPHGTDTEIWHGHGDATRRKQGPLRDSLDQTVLI